MCEQNIKLFKEGEFQNCLVFHIYLHASREGDPAILKNV